jgi:hypothetical protein
MGGSMIDAEFALDFWSVVHEGEGAGLQVIRANPIIQGRKKKVLLICDINYNNVQVQVVETAKYIIWL